VYCHLLRDDLAGALQAADAALPALNRLGHQQLRAWDAAIRTEIAAAQGRFVDAARLQGAAEHLRTELGAVPGPLARLLHATTSLPEGPETDRARGAGAGLGLDGAVACASRTRGRRARPRTGWDSLTPTEGEVVALAAQGLSNDAIGRRLLINRFWGAVPLGRTAAATPTVGVSRGRRAALTGVAHRRSVDAPPPAAARRPSCSHALSSPLCSGCHR
jgi:hypothetical protein